MMTWRLLAGLTVVLLLFGGGTDAAKKAKKKKKSPAVDPKISTKCSTCKTLSAAFVEGYKKTDNIHFAGVEILGALQAAISRSNSLRS